MRADIHAILHGEHESTWLDPDSLVDAKDLLKPYEGDWLGTYPISTIVNDLSNDSSAVIDPIGSESGQTGLDAFGSD